MSLRTLNDVFFTLMRRSSKRLMLTREGETWRTISARQLRSWVYATARQFRREARVLTRTDLGPYGALLQEVS